MQTDGVSKGGWRQDGATVCASTGPHQWFYPTYTDCCSSFIWAWCKTLTFHFFRVLKLISGNDLYNAQLWTAEKYGNLKRAVFKTSSFVMHLSAFEESWERLQRHAGGIIWRCCKHVRSLVWSSNRKLVLAQCRSEERWGEFVALEFYLDGGCWHKKKKRGEKAICLLLNQH